MPTRNIVLTNEPQLITAKAAYIQSLGGVFNFKFSAQMPASLESCHTDARLYQDGTLGSIWAWKNPCERVVLVISEAI